MSNGIQSEVLANLKAHITKLVADKKELREKIDVLELAADLTTYTKKQLEENRLWKAIEENTWDLRCIDEPTGGDDYNVAWIIIEHHIAEPQERQIGYGKTSLEAIAEALKENPHED